MQKRKTMAECEALHELSVTPDQLREIAIEMERKSKSEFYQQGQVIRCKFNNLFSFIYKPERKSQKLTEDSVETFLEEDVCN